MICFTIKLLVRTLPNIASVCAYKSNTVLKQEQRVGAYVQAQEAYWVQQLAGVPTILGLHTDKPRPAQPTHQGNQIKTWFTASTYKVRGGCIYIFEAGRSVISPSFCPFAL